jgi:hypothetical protein
MVWSCERELKTRPATAVETSSSPDTGQEGKAKLKTERVVSLKKGAAGVGQPFAEIFDF